MTTQNQRKGIMTRASIFNDVLGPVMRGPSSSHTAGSYHIGATVRHILGEKAKKILFKFQPDSSYAKTFRPQGVMQAYALAIMGIPITDERFFNALDLAKDENIELLFIEEELSEYHHPNSIEIEVTGNSGKMIFVAAKSTGGGTFSIDRLNDWAIQLNGKTYDLLIQCLTIHSEEIIAILPPDSGEKCDLTITKRGKWTLIQGSHLTRPDQATISKLKDVPGLQHIWQAEPVYFVPMGELLFESAKEMVDLAKLKNWTLQQIQLQQRQP